MFRQLMTGYTGVRKPGIKLTFTSNMPYVDKENRLIDIAVQVLSIVLASGCGYPQEIYIFNFPARNSVPGMWAYFKLSNKSHLFLSVLHCLIITVLLQLSMCLCSSPLLVQMRRGRRCPEIKVPYPSWWMARRHTRFKNC